MAKPDNIAEDKESTREQKTIQERVEGMKHWGKDGVASTVRIQKQQTR